MSRRKSGWARTDAGKLRFPRHCLFHILFSWYMSYRCFSISKWLNKRNPFHNLRTLCYLNIRFTLISILPTEVFQLQNSYTCDTGYSECLMLLLCGHLEWKKPSKPCIKLASQAVWTAQWQLPQVTWSKEGVIRGQFWVLLSTPNKTRVLWPQFLQNTDLFLERVFMLLQGIADDC